MGDVANQIPEVNNDTVWLADVRSFPDPAIWRPSLTSELKAAGRQPRLGVDLMNLKFGQKYFRSNFYP
jgi:hypothetical protein